MNKYQHRGGVQSLISTPFNLQLFAYKEVTNPYEINPFNKNYNTKADISSALVDLSNYARDNIQDYQSITEIPQENLNYLNSGLTASNMRYMFNKCNNLQSIPKLNIDTSQCTNMNSMFSSCEALTTIDLSNFNTSKVTDMGYMFQFCKALTSLDLSNFDTSSVTNMKYMFQSCQALTSLDLSNFNTSNVNIMSVMFNDCQALTSLNLSNWDTSNVTNMNNMFYNCQALEHIEGIIDMKSCTSYITMFYNCPKLSGVKIKNPPDDFESKTKLSPSQYEIVS